MNAQPYFIPPCWLSDTFQYHEATLVCLNLDLGNALRHHEDSRVASRRLMRLMHLVTAAVINLIAHLAKFCCVDTSLGEPKLRQAFFWDQKRSRPHLMAFSSATLRAVLAEKLGHWAQNLIEKRKAAVGEPRQT